MQGMMLWVNFYNRTNSNGVLWLDDEPPSIGSVVFVCETENPDYLMIASSDITNFIPFVVDYVSHIDYIYYSKTLQVMGRKRAGEQISFDTIFDIVPTIERLRNDDLHS